MPFLSIPSNYHDDIESRFDLDIGLMEKLRATGVLYDRTLSGEFFHLPSASFEGRFSFEIVQRVGDYDGHGEVNAPAYLAAEARLDHDAATPLVARAPSS